MIDSISRYARLAMLLLVLLAGYAASMVGFEVMHARGIASTDAYLLLCRTCFAPLVWLTEQGYGEWYGELLKWAATP